jgi:hypothetical protein
MSRRGWKDQRAALFEDADVAFGAPEPRGAAEKPEASDVWGVDADDVWGDPEPRIARGAADLVANDAPASGIWGEKPAASSVWREDPPPVAPVRRKRARRFGFGFLRRRGRKRAAQRTPFDADVEIEDDAPEAPLSAPAAPLVREPAPAPILREAASDPPARRAEPRRARLRWLAPREEPLPKDLVGRDLAGGPPRRARVRRRLPLALLGGGIVAALLLVTLRVEILRLRYAVAEVAAEEQELAERIAQAKFRLRELRDPARLRKLAADRGFVRPERVLQVELPADRASRSDAERARVPEVAAAPAPAPEGKP